MLANENALFGIAWQIDITDQDGTPVLSVKDDGSYNYEHPQIEFHVEQTINTDEYGFWFAEISIYNLNDTATLQTILFGQQVTLQAGWRSQKSGANVGSQTAQYGPIFSGVVYQPLWERIDGGTNYKLTLRCVTSLESNFNAFIGMPTYAGWTQRQVLAGMVNQMKQINPNSKIVLETDASLDANMTPESRGGIIFGRPSDYISNIAKELKGNMWIQDQRIKIANLLNIAENDNQLVPTINYGPTTGIIGTPQQTQDGMTLNVLLDPRVSPGMQIQLQPGTFLNLNAFTLGQNTYPAVVDQTGKYGVMSVTHSGSSRGGSWQTELICVTYMGTIMSLLNPTATQLNPENVAQ